MSTNGADRNHVEFERAVRNSVHHAKRSLLDFLDYQKEQHPDQAPLIGYLMKRIHNDVSIINDQVMAAFRIFDSGGVIPPFGRPEEERALHARAHPRG